MLRRLCISGLVATVVATSTAARADHYPASDHDRGGQYTRYDSYDRDGRYRDDGRYDYGRDDYAWARVVHVQPIRQRVRISEPVRECWRETEHRPDGPLSSRHIGSTLIGSVVGGVLGNQVGRGHGRQVARAAGALIGGAVAYNVSRERNAYDVGYRHDGRVVERCGVQYRDSWVERIEGYDVTYEYEGRRQTTWMSRDPGERIQVRVDVTPVSG